jgi:GNAT superfamily N-acetyltransferase
MTLDDVWPFPFRRTMEATMTSCVTWSIRPGTRFDSLILQRMIYEALYWQPDAEREPFDFVITHPEIARYVDGWGRQGDCAVVACRNPGGLEIGAAWYRLFPEDAPGYGFVDVTVPEIAVAVEESFRGQGVGRALMTTLLDLACRQGVSMLSLSVELSNSRAYYLYSSLGFRRVDGDEHNETMVIDLQALHA